MQQHHNNLHECRDRFPLPPDEPRYCDVCNEPGHTEDRHYVRMMKLDLVWIVITAAVVASMMGYFVGVVMRRAG